MTNICYIPKVFTKAHQVIIAQVNAILEEYAGYTLTVRQVHYQGVAKDWWPNTKSQYDRIVNVISEGRIAGYISWTAIEDRGRNLKGRKHWENPKQALDERVNQFALDLWHGQQYRPEVWVEKQALEGVIGEICMKLRVDFYATKGYNSQSEQWAAGRRFADYIHKGQTPMVFHLGDHDPSGIDMTRDNRERLSLFAGVPITVVRLGLNMDQIERYAPPPNYVKVKANGEYADSRAKAYVDEFGEESWELDALSPRIIHDLIEENVMRLRDEDRWAEMLDEETNDIMVLRDMVEELNG